MGVTTEGRLIVGSACYEEQDARVSNSIKNLTQQLKRRRIDRVDVLDDHQRWPPARQPK